MNGRPYYTAPPAKNLVKVLGITEEAANSIRELAHGNLDPVNVPGVREWLDTLYNPPRLSERLTKALELLTGLEAIPLDPDQNNWYGGWPDPYVEYLNIGDTYTPTLFINHTSRRLFIRTQGD